MSVGKLTGVFRKRMCLNLVRKAAFEEAVLLRQRTVASDYLINKRTDCALKFAVILLVCLRFFL